MYLALRTCKPFPTRAAWVDVADLHSRRSLPAPGQALPHWPGALVTFTKGRWSGRTRITAGLFSQRGPEAAVQVSTALGKRLMVPSIFLKQPGGGSARRSSAVLG